MAGWHSLSAARHPGLTACRPRGNGQLQTAAQQEALKGEVFSLEAVGRYRFTVGVRCYQRAWTPYSASVGCGTARVSASSESSKSSFMPRNENRKYTSAAGAEVGDPEARDTTQAATRTKHTQKTTAGQ